MRAILFFILCLILGTAYPQDVDYKYREDQLYLGVTYGILGNRPTDVVQRNFSYGLSGGIIRDMPINEAHTKAIGIGLGYSLDSYYSNIMTTQTGSAIAYTVITDPDFKYKRSKVELHCVEVPLEIRFRNSTPEDHRFWRLYVGGKIGYAFAARSKFVSSDDKQAFANNDLTRFTYGLSFSVGYNTFNAHVYYALNSLYKEGTMVGSETLSIHPIRVGLIFYIL